MTVLLVCPMKKEFHCAREVLGAAEMPFDGPFRLAGKTGKGRVLHILQCGFAPVEAVLAYKAKFGIPGCLIDSGSCGALSDRFQPGDIVFGAPVLRSGRPPLRPESMRAEGMETASVLEVSGAVSDAVTRSELGHQGELCTMESYRLCGAAADMGAAFYSIRVVTDWADGKMAEDFKRNFRSSCLSLYQTAGEFLNKISH